MIYVYSTLLITKGAFCKFDSFVRANPSIKTAQGTKDWSTMSLLWVDPLIHDFTTWRQFMLVTGRIPPDKYHIGRLVYTSGYYPLFLLQTGTWLYELQFFYVHCATLRFICEECTPVTRWKWLVNCWLWPFFGSLRGLIGWAYYLALRVVKFSNLMMFSKFYSLQVWCWISFWRM